METLENHNLYDNIQSLRNSKNSYIYRTWT